MPISLYTLLSAVFLCAINTAKAGPPPTCTENGPPGTVMVDRFNMYSATVTYYQKTTTINSNPPAKRRRARRQAGTSGGVDQTESTSQNTTDLYPSSESGKSTGGQSSLNLTTIDMTPAEPTAWDCYAGSFQQPSSADCDVVIAAQLYNSTGSLVAPPGTYVFVSYGTCVTVFQNPDPSPYSLQYNWAELGKTAQRIKTSCLTAELNNIGGAAMYDKYLDFCFTDVLISLQRYDSGSSPESTPNATSSDQQSQNVTSPSETQNTTVLDQSENPAPSEQSQNLTNLDQNPVATLPDQTQNPAPSEQSQNLTILDQNPVTTPSDQTQNLAPPEQSQNLTSLVQTQVTPPSEQSQNFTGLDQTPVTASPQKVSGNLYQLTSPPDQQPQNSPSETSSQAESSQAQNVTGDH